MKYIFKKIRKKLFYILFSSEEQVAIINALYRRAHCDKYDIEGDKKIIYICNNIANELML